MSTRRIAQRIILALLQLLVGVAALAGGGSLLAAPDGGALGLELAALDGSPFVNYWIPGLALFVIIGLGSIFGAGLSALGRRRAGDIATALGVLLMSWIALQVAWIGAVHWLQPLFFVLGAVEAGLGWGVRAASRAGARP